MAGEKLNAEQLAEGEALAKAATKGPWEVTYGSDSPAGHGPTFEFAYADICDGERLTPSMRHEDAALIAWMRNNLPALLATAREVERGWEALGISEEDRAENEKAEASERARIVSRLREAACVWEATPAERHPGNPIAIATAIRMEAAAIEDGSRAAVGPLPRTDDPDCETLSQCITVALGYERDQLTEARAEVERLRAELATANHWRDRHAKDSEAYAAQSQTNWTRAESAEREREEMRVALQFYAEGKCRCGVEYQAGERARAALKGGK